MAKKKAKSKTAAIREALRASKDGSPREVAKQLNKRGVKVTAAYVSTIKASDKRKALLGTPVRKPGRPASNGVSRTLPAAEVKLTSDLMLGAVELVIKAGGAENARQLIATAAQIVTKIR